MANYQELINQATIVKNETGPRLNSADRVGSLFLDVINSLKGLDEELDTRLAALAKSVTDLTTSTDAKLAAAETKWSNDIEKAFSNKRYNGVVSNPDTLSAAANIGTYFLLTSSSYTKLKGNGLLTIGFDFYNVITQTFLSPANPVYDESGNITMFKPKPCVLSRRYVSGEWTPWKEQAPELVTENIKEGDKTQKEINQELASDLNDLALKVDNINEKLFGREQGVIDINKFEEEKGYINDSTGLFRGITTNIYSYRIISVKQNNVIRITANDSHSCNYAFLRSYTKPTSNDSTSADYCEGHSLNKIPVGGSIVTDVPNECDYLYVGVLFIGNNIEPSMVEYLPSGTGEIQAIKEEIQETKNDVNTNSISIQELEKKLYDKGDTIDYIGINEQIGYLRDDTGLFRGLTSNKYSYKILDVIPSKTISITANSEYDTRLAFLKTYERPTDNDVYSADYCDGTGFIRLSASETKKYTLPRDCKYLYVSVLFNSNNIAPDDIEYINDISGDIPNIKNDIEELKQYCNGKITESCQSRIPVNPHILDKNHNIIFDGNNVDGSDNNVVFDGHNGVKHILSYSSYTILADIDVNESVVNGRNCIEFLLTCDNPQAVYDAKILFTFGDIVLTASFATIQFQPFKNEKFRCRFSFGNLSNNTTKYSNLTDAQKKSLSKIVIRTKCLSDERVNMWIHRVSLYNTMPNIHVCFDGNWEGVYNLAFPKMRSKFINGTSYVEVQQVYGNWDGEGQAEEGHMTYEQLHKLQDAGWDISNHSWHHKKVITENPSGIPVEAYVADVKLARKWLINNGFIKGANVFATPGGADLRSIRKELDDVCLVVRGGSSTINFGFMFPSHHLFVDGHCIEQPYSSCGNPYNVNGGSPADAVIANINDAVSNNRSANINFHEIFDETQLNKTDNASYPYSEFVKIIDHIANLVKQGKCISMPWSNLYYGTNGTIFSDYNNNIIYRTMSGDSIVDVKMDLPADHD